MYAVQTFQGGIWVTTYKVADKAEAQELDTYRKHLGFQSRIIRVES